MTPRSPCFIRHNAPMLSAMNSLPLLLAVSLAGCASSEDHFESGSRGWLDFRLTSGFGGATYGPEIAIAAGGTVNRRGRPPG
ncbi:MAG: hypothetical protein FD180_2951 [Planctomycetota bacterium]|nr:MAG: hypothetical protein FD180_2951 [Planctomycetota bacterium]